MSLIILTSMNSTEPSLIVLMQDQGHAETVWGCFSQIWSLIPDHLLCRGNKEGRNFRSSPDFTYVIPLCLWHPLDSEFRPAEPTPIHIGKNVCIKGWWSERLVIITCACIYQRTIVYMVSCLLQLLFMGENSNSKIQVPWLSRIKEMIIYVSISVSVSVLVSVSVSVLV